MTIINDGIKSFQFEENIADRFNMKYVTAKKLYRHIMQTIFGLVTTIILISTKVAVMAVQRVAYIGANIR